MEVRIAHAGRLALVGALVTLAFAALAYAGGVAQSRNSGPASADQYGPGRIAITVCHHARWRNGATRHLTIRISARAWPAHRRHGDTRGRCSTAQNKRVHKSKAHAKKFHKPARKR